MIKWICILCFPVVLFAQNGTNDAFAKAETFFKNKQYQKAEPLLISYLKSNPSDAKAIEYLGDIKGSRKNWDEAISYYEQLVDIDPNNANYHYKYGGVMGMKALEVNKFKAAMMIGGIREAFETAATLDSKHIEARWALVEFYMQLPAIIGGSEEKSKIYADQLAKISPVDGYLAHGYIAETNDRLQDAERNYKEAVKIGGSAKCYQKLQEFYENTNQSEKALATIEEAQEKGF